MDKFGPTPAVLDSPPDIDLDIDDARLAEFIDIYVEEYKAKLGEINYKERVDRNKRYLFGRQVEDDKYVGVNGTRVIKSYEKPFVDNVIKEGEDQIRSIVFSKMPDFIITGGETDKSEQTARKISEIVNKRISSDELKRALVRAFRHLPVYFQGVLKWYWDPNKGKNGDFVVEAIHPENIIFDMSANENDPNKMSVIIHLVEKRLKEWIVMFPDKKQQLIEFARSKNKFTNGLDPESEKGMAVKLKLQEVWFDWIKEEKKESESDQEEMGEDEVNDDQYTTPEYKKMSGVCWKTDKHILGKHLDPNWDWEGQEKMFLNGMPIPDEVLPQLAAIGYDIPGIETKKIYRNFFKHPNKPFIFLGYDQWGEMPLDESSRIEDNLYLQENYDYRSMQVTRMIDDARIKHVFSGLSGLKKETVESMDLNDPDQDIFVDGPLKDVYTFIAPEQPSQSMFADQERSRQRILSKVNVHGATRGEVETSVATTNQIAREGDFTAQNSLSEDTVIAAATQIVRAYVHMMKLRYEPEHFQAILGKSGTQELENLQFDMIEDGMEVEVFASGTDKLRQERQAKEDAQLGVIDPLTYFRDTNRSDPEGRAEMLFWFQNAPELYYKKYVEGAEVPDIAEQLQLIQQQRLMAAQNQANPAPQTPQLGAAPQRPSAQDTNNIATTPAGANNGMLGRMQAGIGQILNR